MTSTLAYILFPGLFGFILVFCL